MNQDPIRALAGKVIVAGFEGTSLPGEIQSALQSSSLGGIVLFARNVESHSQVADLIGSARRAAGDTSPPVVAIDQEGGRVVRIRDPLTALPAARTVANANDPELTYRAGLLVGRELRALGFTVNFAPVLDVDTNPESPVIGDRSYGATPRSVIGQAFPFARGLKTGGVFPCAKHFPGHGDATVDSHLSLPVVRHGRERIYSIEMEPFAFWARTGLGPIMTAHIIFIQFDLDNSAIMSRIVLTGELKERLRYSGPILTDDLEMGAIGETGGAGNAAVASINAGAHGLLVCRKESVRHQVLDALVRECSTNPAFEHKLEVAAGQIASLGVPPGPYVDTNWIGSDSHQELRAQVLGALQR